MANSNILHLFFVSFLTYGFRSRVFAASKKVENDFFPTIKKNDANPQQEFEDAVPVVSLKRFLDSKLEGEDDCSEVQADCDKIADALHRYGCVIVEDPRVSEEENSRFLDLMERYFEQSDGVQDARPEVNFQVGVTPAYQETPRDHSEFIKSLPEQHRPISGCPPEPDPKWRFFWRMDGNRTSGCDSGHQEQVENITTTLGPPGGAAAAAAEGQGRGRAATRFPGMYAPPVVPAGFEAEWAPTLNAWGGKMVGAMEAVAEMAARGLGLPPDAFTARTAGGPHLLAPTGARFTDYYDAEEYGRPHPGSVLAGFHYDLNFLTVHGRSRFPGLAVWLRDGRRVEVAVPRQCLLVQAGRQAEALTGGHLLAGFHEVTVSRRCHEAILRAKRRQGGRGGGLWRVSSTCFGAVAADRVLEPLGRFATPGAVAKYPPQYAGEQVEAELRVIGLARASAVSTATGHCWQEEGGGEAGAAAAR